MSTISASTTSTTAYKVTADTTGTLVLQTGSGPTTAVTVGTDQSVAFAGAVSTAGNQTVTGSLSVTGSVSAPNTFGFKNRIINGAMMIDQRNAGASVTPATSATYLTDRWTYSASQASKFTAQQNAGSVTPPAGFVNYLGLTVSSSVSIGAGDFFLTWQKIEGFNIADLGWGTANAQSVTLSFKVYSSLTGTFGGSITNSAQNRSYPFTYTISSANTWTTISVTVAGDTSGTWLTTNGIGIAVFFGLGVGSTYSGTAGAWAGSTYYSATGATSVVGTNGATFYITGVQLEKGSTATSFDYRPYGTELQLCQRYYEIFKNSSGATQNLYLGYQIGGGNAWVNSPFVYQVTKRTTPTVTTSNLGGSNFTFSAANASENYVSLQFTSASAGTTQVYVVNGNTWLTVSAEL